MVRSCQACVAAEMNKCLCDVMEPQVTVRVGDVGAIATMRGPVAGPASARTRDVQPVRKIGQVRRQGAKFVERRQAWSARFQFARDRQKHNVSLKPDRSHIERSQGQQKHILPCTQ